MTTEPIAWYVVVSIITALAFIAWWLFSNKISELMKVNESIKASYDAIKEALNEIKTELKLFHYQMSAQDNRITSIEESLDKHEKRINKLERIDLLNKGDKIE